jgi:secondary thiamine-phosphate synthase enzyme
MRGKLPLEQVRQGRLQLCICCDSIGWRGVFQESFTAKTQGRGTYDITEQIQQIVAKSNVCTGLCHVFIHHTSASVILCENADPVVREDLERFMSSTVPDGDARFLHTSEGDDDMPAHVRTVLTNSALSIPITERRCALGTWQSVYVWEHRTFAHRRRVTLTVQGGADVNNHEA